MPQISELERTREKDMYGNMSQGQHIQILSQLKAFYLAGSSMNETEPLKKKREKKLTKKM